MREGKVGQMLIFADYRGGEYNQISDFCWGRRGGINFAEKKGTLIFLCETMASFTDTSIKIIISLKLVYFVLRLLKYYSIFEGQVGGGLANSDFG